MVAETIEMNIYMAVFDEMEEYKRKCKALELKAENSEKYYQKVLQLEQENFILQQNNEGLSIHADNLQISYDKLKLENEELKMFKEMQSLEPLIRPDFSMAEKLKLEVKQLQQENEELAKELQKERNYSIEDDYNKWASMQSKVEKYKKALELACEWIIKGDKNDFVITKGFYADKISRFTKESLVNHFLNEAKEK